MQTNINIEQVQIYSNPNESYSNLFECIHSNFFECTYSNQPKTLTPSSKYTKFFPRCFFPNDVDINPKLHIKSNHVVMIATTIMKMQALQYNIGTCTRHAHDKHYARQGPRRTPCVEHTKCSTPGDRHAPFEWHDTMRRIGIRWHDTNWVTLHQVRDMNQVRVYGKKVVMWSNHEMNQPYASHIQNQSLLFKNNSMTVMSYMLFTEEHALHGHTCWCNTKQTMHEH